MSAQNNTGDVRLVEAALGRVHDKTAQELIADQLGLLSHSPISRVLSKVRSGKARSLLASYNGEEVNAFYRHHPEFRDSWNATAPSGASPRSALTTEQALRILGKQFTSEVGQILTDVEDGLDAREIDAHLDTLENIAALLKPTRAKLLARKAELARGQA